MSITLPFWFSLDVYLESTNEKVFTGCFTTNAGDIVTGFYETIGELTNFDNNLLLNLSNPTKYKHEKQTVYNIINTGYDTYDNVYKLGWKQFDSEGVALRNTSYFNDVTAIKFNGNFSYNEIDTNEGYIYKYVNNKFDSSIKVLFIINNISDPTTLPLWYSLSMTLNDNAKTPVFNGFFKTTLSNIVTGVYETIKGETNFDDNILSNSKIEPNMKYKDFLVYRGGKVSNNYLIDHAYKPNWIQFDTFGLLIKYISYYNDNNTELNFCAVNDLDETITNVGYILRKPDKSKPTEYIKVVYTITPILDPTPIIPSPDTLPGIYFASATAFGYRGSKTEPSVIVTTSASATATSSISQEDAQNKAKKIAQRIANDEAYNNANLLSQSVAIAK